MESRENGDHKEKQNKIACIFYWTNWAYTNGITNSITIPLLLRSASHGMRPDHGDNVTVVTSFMDNTNIAAFTLNF